MELKEFFSQCSSLFQYNYPVLSFTGKTYQPIFLKKIYSFIEQQIGQSLHVISTEQETAAIQAKLSTTFLGKKHWYLLDGISTLSSKKKKTELVKFIQQYQGPHRIVTFIQESEKVVFDQNAIEIIIHDSYGKDQIKDIKVLYEGQSLEATAYFFSKLYRLRKEYSLDQLCFFKEYAMLLGRNMNLFFDQWFEKIVTSDISLFQLSQLFFEKNTKDFFIKWQKIRANYVDQFWIAFFSEQLFKAYFYVNHQGRLPADQKQLSFGLPFSFLKHDFKMYTADELLQAHKEVYQLDLSLKNSGAGCLLDAFFIKFFTW